MGATEAAALASSPVTFRSRAEAEEVLGRTLELIECDDSIGPALHAAGVRERLRLSDLDLTLEFAAGGGERCIDWSIVEGASGAPFDPSLSLTMTAAVANSLLQGAESIGVAIARGRIEVSGKPGAVLVHMPAMRLINAEYKALIAAEYPHLVIHG
jgi:hypothetical protein